MKSILLRALILYSTANDPISEERQCSAVASCQGDHCDVLVHGECDMILEECLDTARVMLQGRDLDVLGCAPHARELVVEK